MKNITVLLFILCFPILAFSQVQQNGLVGYFSFSDCQQVDTTNSLVSDNGGGIELNIIRPDGNVNCVEDCGVLGNGFSLNGNDEQLFFSTGFNNLFDEDDFSISFYFRPEPSASKMNLFLNAEDCSENNHFAIDYNPAGNEIEVILSESPGVNANVSGDLDPNRCWQHVAFVREAKVSRLYLNGLLVDENTAVNRIDISNSSVLVFASNQCFNRFQGLIDEIAIYNAAITPFDVRDLFFQPEEIRNRDTTIFLGGSVQIDLTNNCADTYNWFPNTEISDASIANPLLTPTADAVYEVELIDAGCTAIDQITITVVDADALDCNEIFFPKAFTPNGDNLNDEFKIGNPFTIDGLISFEILDRWGSRVFITDDAFEGWDGNFDGQVVNPGVMLYRVRFLCDDKENTQVGSLTLLR